jgi:D-alanine-D-alanine ligase-like ATP-grasp enzyme
MAITLKQYYGATRRHPEACVEASFPDSGEVHSLRVVAESLRRAGSPLPALETSVEFGLPEAVGTLASAILAVPVPPRWHCGRDGDTGWVCMTHANPLLARAALLRAHAAILAEEPASALLVQLMGGNVSIRRTTVLIMEAATALGLSATHVSQRAEVFQVGEGPAARSFYELANHHDSITGLKLATDKLASLDILRRMGMPTTSALPVSDTSAANQAVRRIGFPCVIKPIDRGKGVGVTTRIRAEHEVAAAVAHAARFSSFPVMVENHVEGHDHRMLVVDGKLLWVYRRTQPYVTGDGVSTVAALIGRENLRREAAGDAYLKPLVMDAAMERHLLEHHALAMDSIPPADAHIHLCGQANLAQGGTLKEVTANVHADNLAMAVQVARLFRVSALGIDFITPDISRSWKDIPSAIIEVNTVPGISGLGDACLALRTMMPGRLSGKVPTFVLIGDDAYLSEARRAVTATLTASGLTAGICAFMRPPPALRGAADAFRISRSVEVERLLLDPGMEALVVACAPADIERHGFPVHGCDLILAQSAEIIDGPAGLEHIKMLARRLVTGAADTAMVTREVEAILEPFLAQGQGGPRPVLEWTGDPIRHPDGTLTRTMRCWRVRALPRSGFQKGLPLDPADADPPAGGGMIGRDYLLHAVRRFAGIRLRETGSDHGSIRLFASAGGRSWDTPFVDVAVSVGPGQEQVLVDAIEYGVTAVNALIAGLD